ncbi:hypothetical protein Lal_00003306 [Lupinus albus]|uniref:Putative PLAT/LH2 domain-containing protein n=1 Tax=Lupinus albus TaxID=3870 RepID=A0A6A4NKE8_LUPAL|nr:putative PLAT/LH2 domain-containing protein [Lupinus albus]KAF1883124.1 hypothetical protein Lal_00003306 [Lupinus albus]
MKKVVTLILTMCIISTFSQANPIAIHPQPNQSFKLNRMPQQVNCHYTAHIKTSCISPSYTGNQISVAFGDTYGSQVYVPKLDHLSLGSFDQCSISTFEIDGPCNNQVCYLFLYTTGYDGWIPESVTISGYNAAPISFVYNTAVPHGVWYGYNVCNNGLEPILPYNHVN